MQLRLTTEVLKTFVGGQMEIQNKKRGYIYRGEIAKAVVEGNKLVVIFAWIAKGEGYPPLPSRWIAAPNDSYKADLELCSVSDIGPSTEGGNRICLANGATSEVVTFFPPDGSKIDRSNVEGLD